LGEAVLGACPCFPYCHRRPKELRGRCGRLVMVSLATDQSSTQKHEQQDAYTEHGSGDPEMSVGEDAFEHKFSIVRRQSVHAFAFGVELAADERDAGDEIKPDEQHNDSPETSVEDVVTRDAV
jgi:hypothetical protein